MESQQKIRLPRWSALTSIGILGIALIVALIQEWHYIHRLDTAGWYTNEEDISSEEDYMPFPEGWGNAPTNTAANPDDSEEKVGVTRKGYRFIMPVQGRISSKYGYRQDPMGGGRSFHRGIDSAAPMGSPVLATADGIVSYVGKRPKAGNMIYVRHSSRYQSRYFHLSKIEVKRGQRVKQGDIIGRVGSTGMSTGPHLHFELIRGTTTLDPLKYLPSE